MSDELLRIANALERIADFYEKGLHVDIDHAHIDDIDNYVRMSMSRLYLYQKSHV